MRNKTGLTTRLNPNEPNYYFNHMSRGWSLESKQKFVAALRESESDSIKDKGEQDERDRYQYQQGKNTFI